MSNLLFLALLAPETASACGGFFCNQEPVDQSAEQIAFAVDADAGEITMHTRIFYTGPAEEFAWVVPVPANPEIFVSTDTLFTTLSAFTQPWFFLNWKADGCEDSYWGYAESDFALDDADSAAPESGSGGSVTVVSQSQVGAYDTVVLTATTSAALVEWLQDNDYDVPSAYETVVAPYIASNSHFVALKLQSDKDTGDISPLGLRYPGTQPTIPIQLTSIAATPDMRLEVYLFGDERSVPESYLHVQINEAAVNWFDNGSNYNDVITEAANEAGGNAFATDFSGDPGQWKGILYNENRFDLDALRAQDNPVDYLNTLMGQGFMGSLELLALFEEFIPIPEELVAQGVTSQDFYNCIECWDYDFTDYPFDPEAMTDALDERIVTPLREADKMFDHAKLSRMTSSLSPAEMTVDPTFVFNGSMGDVSNQHEADLTFLCNEKTPKVEDAVRQLDLADGRTILYPPMSWFNANGISEDDYVSDLAEVNALVIERTGSSGDPEVLFDYTSSLDENIDAHNDEIEKEFGKAGCGCAVTDARGMAAVGLVFLAAVARRRQR